MDVEQYVWKVMSGQTKPHLNNQRLFERDPLDKRKRGDKRSTIGQKLKIGRVDNRIVLVYVNFRMHVNAGL